ncbi:MAG: hypothetical protein K8R86_02080 [Bacteroidales bacterium]|nr:hypothetical protein [Bacteroidales bacterium]
MKTKWIYQVLLILFCVTIFASCEYDFVEPEPQSPPPDPGETISFNDQIVPIFTSGDKCTLCHKTNSTDPDLTPDNAYNSITNMGLVNTDSPADSEIYTYASPAVNNSHSTPPKQKYTENEAAFVLQWIEQGAEDN